MCNSIKLTLLSILFPIFLHGQFDVSIGTGSIWVDGDVDILCGIGSVNSFDIAVDYQLINQFYFGASIGYGNAKGLEQFVSWQGKSLGGGLLEPIYQDYDSSIYAPYHSTNILTFSLGLSYKLYLSHDNLFIKVGVRAGYSKVDTYMNLYDADNNIYELPPSSTTSFQAQDPTYPPELFDDSFETHMDNIGTVFQYGPRASLGFNITKNSYIGIAYSIQILDTDYLDGIAWRTSLDKTNNNDMIHQAMIEYTHRFGTFNW